MGFRGQGSGFEVLTGARSQWGTGGPQVVCLVRGRANTADTRKSRPELRTKVLKTFSGVPASLGSGTGLRVEGFLALSFDGMQKGPEA